VIIKEEGKISVISEDWGKKAKRRLKFELQTKKNPREKRESD